MTDESQEVAQKSKKAKGKNKDFKKKGQKRSAEDGGKVKKHKLKKPKKAKKDDAVLAEQVEAEDIDESLEENFDEDGQTIKKKGPSKRQLKREKAAKIAAEVKETNKLQSIEKALNYISKWKHARSQWKFEKVKQIWLISHLLDDTYIPDEHFPVVLEYFEGCKGQARKQLIDKAMQVVRKAEDNVEEDEEVVETTEYKRARQLLQALPTET